MSIIDFDRSTFCLYFMIIGRTLFSMIIVHVNQLNSALLHWDPELMNPDLTNKYIQPD